MSSAFRFFFSCKNKFTRSGLVISSVLLLLLTPFLVASAMASNPPSGNWYCPTCRTSGYGQSWVYNGSGPTTGLTITGGQGAIAASSGPGANGAVISATSTTTSPAFYANNSGGGLAFRFDGNGILNGALSASNLAVSGATSLNNLDVVGTTSLSGNVTVGGVLNLNGGLNLSNFQGPLNLSAQVNGDAVVKGANTATDAVAAGMYGYSPNGRGLIGASQNGNGVYASSNGSQPALYAGNSNGPAFGFNGNGSITANTPSNPALSISNGNGAGLQVSGNTSLNASSGTALSVQGNASKAIVAQNSGGIAVEGDSSTGVGIYGNSTQYNGVVAQNNSAVYPALYSKNSGGGTAAQFDGDTVVKGNLTVTGSKSGYVVDIAQNDGSDTLEAGEVVVITGYAPAVVGNIPAPKVKKASSAYAVGVMGVVDQHYTIGNGNLTADKIAPGDYLSVVTLGAYQTIKVDSSNGPIAPGDLLVSSGANPGYAAKASLVSSNGVPIAPAGVVGKALGPLDSGSGTIPVLVTLK